MAISFLKSISGTSTTNNPTSSFSGGTSAGSLIVVTAETDAGVASYLTGITDTQGNTYSRITSNLFGSGTGTVEAWYAKGVAGGATTTLTFGWTAAGASNVSWVGQEFAGCDTSAPLDKFTTLVEGASTAPLSGTSAATTQADELVVGFFGHTGATTTATAGSGYSNLVKNGVSTAWAFQESKIVAATGTQQAGATLGASRTWAAILATFKGATAGGSALSRTGMLAYA